MTTNGNQAHPCNELYSHFSVKSHHANDKTSIHWCVRTTINDLHN